MISSVTALLTIRTAGRPFCTPPSVTLSPACRHTQHLVCILVLKCVRCPLQERCVERRHTNVLCPLLGLIVNISTVASPVIRVRVVICLINGCCNYPKGTWQKMNNCKSIFIMCTIMPTHSLLSKSKLQFVKYVLFPMISHLSQAAMPGLKITPLGFVFAHFPAAICASGLYGNEANVYYYPASPISIHCLQH